MQPTVESLLQSLLTLTENLANQIVEHDDDPDVWEHLIEERQSLLDQLEEQMQAGAVVPEEWRVRYIQPVLALDQAIGTRLQKGKAKLQTQLQQVRKSKLANQQYGGYGKINAYGAFFDKKK